MAENKLLEKITSWFQVLLLFSLLSACKEEIDQPLKLAISPYQDLAMIENYKHLKLEEKYNVKVNLITLPWEEILPSIGSEGTTVDIGFASYIEYLNKAGNLNKNTKDSILFIYPAYVFTGGGFTTFKKDFPVFTTETVKDTALLRKFLSYKIGAQKNSMFDMSLYQLANYAGVKTENIKVIDVPMADGVFALQSGSLDFASAGLTQRNEIERLGGKVVLNFNTIGFADITGFICKRSVYKKRKREIEALIKTWYECVAYMFEDVDNHVTIATLPYLDKNASTKYTIESYKAAIGQEVFPKSIEEAKNLIIADTAHFSATQIYNTVKNYLSKNSKGIQIPMQPRFITIE